MTLLKLAKPAMQQLCAGAAGLRQTGAPIKQLNSPPPLGKLPSDAEAVDAPTYYPNAGESRHSPLPAVLACCAG